MSYVITEEWVTDVTIFAVQIPVYTVHNDDVDGIEKTFRWYSDAERYRDALNEGASTETAADNQDDSDDYRDLLIDARLGVR